MDGSEKITSRHIGKLLEQLDVFNLPDIAKNEIIRRMHFLKKDLVSNGKLVSEVRYNGLDKSSHR